MLWRPDRTHQYNPTKGNFTRLQAITALKTGGLLSIRVRARLESRSFTPVDRLSAHLRLKDLEPIPIVHHPHPQVRSTFCHHARGSDSCRRQRAVRIWSRYSHRSHFLPFFRTHRVNHCTAPRLSYPLSSGSLPPLPSLGSCPDTTPESE